LDEKENTDFIYYGTTEMVGLHTRKPLKIYGHLPKSEQTSFITSTTVFPEYYMIYVEKFEDQIHEDIDEWVYFFKYGNILPEFKSSGILLAAKKLDYLSMDGEERRSYDGYLAYLGEELGILDTAKAEGIAEGIAEGMAEGKIKGIVLSLRQRISSGRLTLQEASDEIHDLEDAGILSSDEVSRSIIELGE
jgi:hypothetical protein